MKVKVIGTLSLVVVFTLITLTAKAGEKSVFANLTFSEALVAGEKSNKPIVVKFHADWCQTCKKMDRETYTDKNVTKALKNFISIVIDIETKDGLALAQEFGVQGVPTIAVFNPQGKNVYFKKGFHSPKQMENVLKQVSD